MKLTKYILSVFISMICTVLFSLTVSAQESQTTESSIVEETTVSTTAVTNPLYQNGWNNIDGSWMYFIDDTFLTGIQQIDGQTYLFAANGSLKTGWQTINNQRRFFDYNTHSELFGWVEWLGSTYYNDVNFGKLTGMHNIDGKQYIFSDEGIMQKGDFVRHNGFIYYCTYNGSVLNGKGTDFPVLINGNYYLILPEGYVMLGWQKIKGHYYYYDYETAEVITGWIKFNDNYYYSDRYLGRVTGEFYIDERPYMFDENGKFQSGLQKFSDNSACFYYEDLSYAVGFQTINNQTYYFDVNGYMQTGWQNINSKKYYFNEKGIMTSGFSSINGNRYYFDANGIMQTGIIEINGSKYYFDSNGVMQTGFIEINGSKYYFDSNGVMQTGFIEVSKNKYYFTENGAMQTGFIEINGNKYYFSENGAMQTGIVEFKGNTYYFNDDGIMQTGLQIVDGKYYNLDSSGKNKPIKVFVGVGHGGYDPGAIGYIVEKEYTLKTAKVVEQHLKDAGIEYILSRDDDIDTTMESKLKLCNDYDPDLIIDIHFNAVGGNGFEVYHAYSGGMSKTLAENINAEVEKIMYSTGCKIFLRDGVDRFTIIRETHAPAVLLEGGYVDNYNDAMFIKENFHKLAKAYAEGILKTIRMMFG